MASSACSATRSSEVSYISGSLQRSDDARGSSRSPLASSVVRVCDTATRLADWAVGRMSPRSTSPRSEIGQDLRDSAEEDEVTLVVIVVSPNIGESSLLKARHGYRIISIKLAVPDENLRLDVFETE